MTRQSTIPPAPQTRGFLFADLRGYSKFTDEHGDRAAEELLGRYRDLARAEIAAFHGAEIRTEGDSFYVVFASVSEAVQAGIAIRDAAATASGESGLAPIRVGIGIHAGEAADGSQGIVSSAVNIAARVCAQAEPGEVLVTDTVRSLTRTFLPTGFTSRGRRRLKGITEPVQLYRVETGASAGAGRTVMRRVPLRIGLATMAVLIVVVAAVLVMNRPAGVGGTRSTPTPEASVAASESAGFGVDVDRYTDAAAAALLDRLPASVAASCERADLDERPEFVFPLTSAFVVRNPDGTLTREFREFGTPDRVPFAVSFGLTCLTNLTRVVFWQASGDQGGAEELFFNLIVRRSIEAGSCGSGGRAFEAWEAGAHAGHVMCFEVEGAAVVEWTFADANVYAIASRRDGDGRELYAWWRETGRLLGR